MFVDPLIARRIERAEALVMRAMVDHFTRDIVESSIDDSLRANQRGHVLPGHNVSSGKDNSHHFAGVNYIT